MTGWFSLDEGSSSRKKESISFPTRSQMKGAPMAHSRREFLKTALGGTAALAPLTIAAATTISGSTVTPDQIIDLFEPLPGQKALKIFAPAAGGKPEFVAQLNSGKKLFVASADKTYLLCEALRQVDSPDVVKTLEDTKLELNSTIWSVGSPFFDPPNLKGIVSERATMEAMITNSDNTATDMIFKVAGADNVRSFIASAGLTQTLIPDSTRALSAYLFGAKNYLTITWKRLKELLETGELTHPFLNDVETFASSANDFVSYYSLALQGAFFDHSETLNEFRRILTLCDFIYLIPLPLGVSAYAKSGNVDFPKTEKFPGFHVRSIAGGIFFGDHWVYYAFIINWDNPNPEDPETVSKFFSAINQALTLIKNSLS
jgi:beta-lactamase class A